MDNHIDVMRRIALNDNLIYAYENWQNELRENINQYTLS